MSDKAYYIYLWITYNMLDVITTELGISLGHVEANPIPALIAQLSIPSLLPTYKLAAALLWLLALVILANNWRRLWLALRIGNILVFGAVLNNLLLIVTAL